jgi:hypothetical protein
VAGVFDTSPAFLRIKALPKLMARPAVLAKGLALVTKLVTKGTVETLGVRQPRSGWKRVVSDPDQA